MTSVRAHAHLVRPRWVWAALFTSLTGLVVLGIAVMLLSWWLGVLGALLLAAGVLVGWLAGWQYDVHASRAASRELAGVAEGGPYKGIQPGQTIVVPAVKQTAAELDARRRRILARSHESPRRPLADLGAGLLLLVAVILLVAQWEIYPRSATGQGNGLHATWVAVVVTLVGLRVLTGHGPHRAAAALGLLAGTALIVLAWLARHSAQSVAVFETVCGGAIAVSSFACLDARRRR